VRRRARYRLPREGQCRAVPSTSTDYPERQSSVIGARLQSVERCNKPLLSWAYHTHPDAPLVLGRGWTLCQVAFSSACFHAASANGGFLQTCEPPVGPKARKRLMAQPSSIATTKFVCLSVHYSALRWESLGSFSLFSGVVTRARDDSAGFLPTLSTEGSRNRGGVLRRHLLPDFPSANRDQGIRTIREQNHFGTLQRFARGFARSVDGLTTPAQSSP
jgi:hypothetical protein